MLNSFFFQEPKFSVSYIQYGWLAYETGMNSPWGYLHFEAPLPLKHLCSNPKPQNVRRKLLFRIERSGDEKIPGLSISRSNIKFVCVHLVLFCTMTGFRAFPHSSQMTPNAQGSCRSTDMPLLSFHTTAAKITSSLFQFQCISEVLGQFLLVWSDSIIAIGFNMQLIMSRGEENLSMYTLCYICSILVLLALKDVHISYIFT